MAKKLIASTYHVSAMLQLASEADIFAGIDWYDRAYRFANQLTDKYNDLTLAQAVGVIAALSPNNRWERNCQDADNLISVWSAGGDLSLVKVCTYGANKAKAIAILSIKEATIDDIAAILNGQKITSFFRSIMGQQDNVCVDGHAYSVFIGHKIPTHKTPSISKGLYATIQRSYQLVAKRSEKLCGHKLTPVQVQAVTWVAFKRLVK